MPRIEHSAPNLSEALGVVSYLPPAAITGVSQLLAGGTDTNRTPGVSRTAAPPGGVSNRHPLTSEVPDPGAVGQQARGTEISVESRAGTP